MDNKQIIYYGKLLLLAVALQACFNNNNKKMNTQNNVDEFYIYTRYEDLYRLPLIKPLELTSVGGEGYGWTLKFPYQKIDDNVETGILDKIAVEDSLIIVYIERTYLYHNMTEAWFTIDLKEKKEYAFTKEADYNAFLKAKHIDSVTFYSPDELFKQFDEKRTLPWLKQPYKPE